MKKLLVFVLVLALASSAAAQTSVVKQLDPLRAKARWTPEAFAGARPLPLPRIDFDASRILAEPKAAEAQEPFVDHFPSVAAEPTLRGAERYRFRTRIYDLSPAELRALLEKPEPEALPEPLSKNYGTGGLDYTSSRLIPSEAGEAFPYAPVGKLFFSIGENSFVCSGAVIAPRLVLTAGHCVHGGPGQGFFDDFTFIPAFNRGDAPFGTWTATAAFVTPGWAASGGVPHPQDYAFLEIADQDGTSIGDVTGRLAFLPDRLADNHLHLLGYPGNLDGGQEMHQITTGDFFAFNDGTVVYGSDMTGGSSGGPWVQNFNRKASGQGGGQNRARAAVVAVTSYGFTNAAIRAQGGSEFQREFRVLRQDACFNQPGNC
jgi:V8-like Glu-specific endopeptidase